MMEYDVDDKSTVLFPTSSKESEISSEPNDEINWLSMMDIEDKDVSLLTDEDGDEEDLINKILRIIFFKNR